MGNDDVLALIEKRLGEHAGLKMPAWLLSSRVSDRMRALGLATMEDYVKRLESPAERDALSEALRVGETAFFRHGVHMGAVRRVVAPDLAARHAEDRRVRAWSAGCASGEEPYSLAMLLAEVMPPERGWRIEVLATDISEEALEVARRGHYSVAALRNVPALLRDRWFRRDGDGWTVGEALGQVVRFERRNLVDPHWGARGMDVIFCRNVLIYFDPAARTKTAHRLIETLAPGGYLFFGYAESLRDFDELEALRSDDGVIYRRPLKGRLPTPVSAPAPVRPAVFDTKPRPPDPPPPKRPSDAKAEVVVRLTGSYETAQGLIDILRRAIASATRRLVVDLDAAEFLGDEVAGALRRAAAAAAAAGLGFELRATRPGPRRFVTRHNLGRPA